MQMLLVDVDPALETILTRGAEGAESLPRFSEDEIQRRTVFVGMRDGVRLATDIYLPPVVPAAVVVTRTPYGRATDKALITIMALARRGLVVVSQDCRGTGESEPDTWDYYVYEPEDGVDVVQWVTEQQWFNGELYSFGASYASGTQFAMAAHPRMSAIIAEVGGLRTTRTTVRPYMFVNGYARTVGKGANRVAIPVSEIEREIQAETMAGGYFNEPLRRPLPSAVLNRYPNLAGLPIAESKRWIWRAFCSSPPSLRAELLKEITGQQEFSYIEMCSLQTIFDCMITYGVHTIPSADAVELTQRIRAPVLMVTGWYDWNLGDILPSWMHLRKHALDAVASCSRLIITPAAHHAPGYREGEATHRELRHNHRANIDLMTRWYESTGSDSVASWPRVVYYLMGANEWRCADDWPVPEARALRFYLGSASTLTIQRPTETSSESCYTYDPDAPTPTRGGSILSFLYTPGSVDVSDLHQRPDVLTFSTDPFGSDLDVVGPIRLSVYASSTAVDTDFAARLTDVFPDGRAIQLQSGILRARFRNIEGEPELLQPKCIYRFDIDMWATANRFKVGHRLRLDICSADFPRFDRNTNRGGEPGAPVRATQTIYHCHDYPSHLELFILHGPGLSVDD